MSFFTDFDLLVSTSVLDTGSINNLASCDNESAVFIDTGQCLHRQILTLKKTSFCQECGYETIIDNVPEYGFHQIRTKKVRGIIDDLQKTGFTGKIAKIADQLYTKISNGKIYRGNSRKSIVFASIFNAFKLENNPQSFDSMVKIFNINRKSALKGLKISAHHVPPKCMEIDETVIIKHILDKFDSFNIEYYEQIVKMYQSIQDKSSLINRSRPTSVVCGLVYYFIVSCNKDITLQHYSENITLSSLTILKICKEIDGIIGTAFFNKIQK